MNQLRLYLIIILIVVSNGYAKAQAPSAPSLRCLSVNGNSVVLTWVIPPDPSGLFTSYQIYNAFTQLGPYTLVGTVNNYNQTSFVHTPANGSTQSQYYFVKTISSATNTSLPSDTLRTLFLNLNNTGGKAILNWNATHAPLLPTASNSYTLLRQTPGSAWMVLYTGSNLNYTDSISICTVTYNYKVQTTDALGCISESNRDGGVFHDVIQPFVPLLDSVTVNANGFATLGWQPSSSADAVGYVIFKNINGIWTALDTVKGHSTTIYTHTNSTASTAPESFFITAIDSCKNISPPGIDQKTILLSSKYDLCARTANLIWTAYGNLPKGILKYDVYTVSAGVYNFIGSTTSNAFAHSNLVPGTTYCYVVKVRNTNNTISANSNSSCVLATAPQGPRFVYLRSVSVTKNNQIQIIYEVDNTKPYKGSTIFKSLDGINFTALVFNPSTTNGTQTITDTEVKTTEKNYYYKVQLTDSCGNAGLISDASKSILLKVSNDTKNIYLNTLTWDDYYQWSGTVSSYNIYRAINGVFDATPIDNVFVSVKSYTDNVENFYSENGKFSYYVEAVEGAGNIYGFTDKATSNPADAYVEATFFVPNAFAPKGRNDTWLPRSQFVEKTDYKVMVFNRWGSIVFETTNDAEGWNGSNAKDDVYIYLIQYKNARGEFIELKGHISVLR